LDEMAAMVVSRGEAWRHSAFSDNSKILAVDLVSGNRTRWHMKDRSVAVDAR
jgi:hypothetical protein